MEDGGTAAHKCEMCCTAKVRYVHIMTHPDFVGSLRVGCICAGRMEQESSAAKRREIKFKKYLKACNKWLTADGWRVSRKGNHYRNVDRCNVVVYPLPKGWWFRVVHRVTGIGWVPDAPYETEDEAKRAAFDRLPRNFPELDKRIADREDELELLWFAAGGEP